MTARPRIDDILAQLRALGSERNRAGMARYGINVANAFGVSVPVLRKLARTWRGDFRFVPVLSADWPCLELTALRTGVPDD